MNGYFIEITNNLLEPKHREAMGESVWLFMWFLDKITSISEEGIGKVLGGKPIKYNDLNEDFTMPERTYKRYLARLKETGYINTLRTPHGLVITVNKAKKRFGQRYANYGTSPDKSGTSIRYAKSGTSNIRQDSIDNTSDNNIAFETFWKEYPRKVNKKGALRSWNKIKPSALQVASIMVALKNHKESDQWNRDNGAYIPHTTTWLNQERWKTMLPKAKVAAKKPFYQGDPMVQKNGKWFVIRNGEWLQFAGKQEEIIYE